MHPFPTEFMTALGGYRARWRAYRDEARTRRIIDGLPSQIRKDIGWPDVCAGGDPALLRR